MSIPSPSMLSPSGYGAANRECFYGVILPLIKVLLYTHLLLGMLSCATTYKAVYRKDEHPQPNANDP